jgi:hypothetical protein
MKGYSLMADIIDSSSKQGTKLMKSFNSVIQVLKKRKKNAFCFVLQ